MSNTEWLKSLTDRQLAEEIKYSRLLANGPNSFHRTQNRRELDEALQEREARESRAAGVSPKGGA